MNKKIVIAFRLIVMLALVIMLPMESLAASSTEDLAGDISVMDEIFLTVDNETTSANIAIESSHAAAEGITSLQFSLQVDANGQKPEFVFSDELKDVTIAEYRYDSSTGRMNIYLSGKTPLFVNKEGESNENVFLNIGSVKLSDSILGIQAVDGSLKYVYGSSVREQAMTKNADIARVSVDSNISGASLSVSIGHDLKQGTGEISLYGLTQTGNTVTVSAPEKVDNYEFVSWINSVTGESVSNLAEDSFELSEGISLRAIYEEAENTDPIVTVEGGTIVNVNGMDVSSENITKNSYSLNTLLTVQANEVEGQYFAGWYMLDGEKEVLISTDSTYRFYLKASIAIKAKFEENEVEAKPAISLSRFTRIKDSAGKDNVTLTISVDVPEGYTVVSEGILRAYKNLGEKKMIVGASGVTNNTSKTVFSKGDYNYSFTIAKTSSNISKTVYARGYLRYKDSEGTIHTEYTDIKELEPILSK